MRLFIAIAIPDDVRTELGRVQDMLRRSGTVEASWPKPDNIHLTLKFLGEVPEEKVREIISALKGAAQSIGPLILAVNGTGAFPDGKTARVVWAGIGGDTEKLGSLQSAVESAMETLGYPKEHRTFSPHLTLGRIKHITSRAGWLKVFHEVRLQPHPAFTVHAMELMRSELKPSGAVYTVLEQIVLGS